MQVRKAIGACTVTANTPQNPNGKATRIACVNGLGNVRAWR